MYRIKRTRGPVWYAKYRLPDGRQVEQKVGPSWSERGPPPAGYVTKREAEDWLRSVLDEARRGTLLGMISTGATFADAAAEYMRWCEHDRSCKPSTLRDYRSNLNAHLLPEFGAVRLKNISSGVDRPMAGIVGRTLAPDQEQAPGRHARGDAPRRRRPGG